MAAEQAVLPFDESEAALQSVLTLDDSVIPEGSLALAGFSWDDLTGEVFEDGYVAFHDGTEYVIPVENLPRVNLNYVPDDVIVSIIKVAHDIKVGKKAEEQ